MSKGIYINSKWIDHETLMSYARMSNNGSDFEKSTVKFYQDWHNGRETFTQFTSGTTGNAKPVNISRQKMKQSARLTLTTLDVKTGTNALLCLDPKFIGGKMMMVRAFIGGLNLIAIEPSSDPFQKLTVNLRIDFTAVVHQQLRSIVDHPYHYKQYFNSNTKIIVGGSKLDQELESQTLHLPYDIYHTFGMTETVSHIALKKLTDPPNNLFRVLQGIDIDIDHRSCLMIKGVVTDHQWLMTNDIVEIPEKGSFVWKGRYDNVINSGGVKIFPESIEKKIAKVFSEWEISVNFFVTSIPDDILGEKMVLFIETEGNSIKPEETLRKLKPLLPRYMSPKKIFLLPQFIYTQTGKIDRNNTKERLLQL